MLGREHTAVLWGQEALVCQSRAGPHPGTSSPGCLSIYILYNKLVNTEVTYPPKLCELLYKSVEPKEALLGTSDVQLVDQKQRVTTGVWNRHLNKWVQFCGIRPSPV